jgi:hypothetical protein
MTHPAKACRVSDAFDQAMPGGVLTTQLVRFFAQLESICPNRTPEMVEDAQFELSWEVMDDIGRY